MKSKNIKIIYNTLCILAGILLTISILLLVIIHKNNVSDDNRLVNETESFSTEVYEAVKNTEIDNSINTEEQLEYQNETFGTVDNLQFIIDITHADSKNNLYRGNTATSKSYSGIIYFYFTDKAINGLNIHINTGDTYIVEASPIIDTDEHGFPLLSAVNYKKASKDDIKKLDNIRKDISNYKRKKLDYRDMTLDEIIDDANISYATWTQDEIKEYIKYIKTLGYSDKHKKKSYVTLRDNIKETYISENKDE